MHKLLKQASLASLALSLSPALGAAPAAAPRPMNIVFVLADDLGTDWVGSYGAGQPTPGIDRLARDGTRFETAWTCPICTPSRVMLLTGQYPGRTGWTEHYDVPRWGGDGLIPGKFPTWPRLLEENGYATAIVGKWQINDLRLRPDILKEHGFDHYCVWTGVESDNPPSERRYWDPFLQIDGVRKAHPGEYGPDITQRYALDFIRENKDRPFLLYYPTILVHAPNEPTPDNRASNPKGEAACYAGSVSYLDKQVGELLDELDRLGIADRTAVIFAGDNGSSTGGRLNDRHVPPGKGRTTERGVHVPLLIKLPGSKPGTVTDALTDLTDLFPTFLEIAGLKAKTPDGLDGRSLVPLLLGSPDYRPREWIYAQRDRSRTVRDKRFKLDSSGGFFDVSTDPDQTHPVSPAGDPAAAEAHRKLAAVLASIPAQAPEPPFPAYTPLRMRNFGHGKTK